MFFLSTILGCFSPGPALVPPAHFQSVSVRLDSEAGHRLQRQQRRRQAAFASHSPKEQLPEAWRPATASRIWTSIVLHHTATDSGTIESIDAVHRRRRDRAGRPWLGIGYHFLIGNGNGMPDGQITPTFRWEKQLHGAHAGDRQRNETGIGICLVGDFEKTPPTAKQLTAVMRLVKTLQTHYGISPQQTIGHDDVKATKCPGKHFPLAKVAGRETTDPRER
jgi:hypothetical protein